MANLANLFTSKLQQNCSAMNLVIYIQTGTEARINFALTCCLVFFIQVPS